MERKLLLCHLTAIQDETVASLDKKGNKTSSGECGSVNIKKACLKVRDSRLDDTNPRTDNLENIISIKDYFPYFMRSL